MFVYTADAGERGDTTARTPGGVAYTSERYERPSTAAPADPLRELTEKREWYMNSIKVLSGNFTDPSDRRRLVPTILGLWATVLRNRSLKRDAAAVGSFDLVKTNYTEVFPPEYFADLLPRLETQVQNELEVRPDKGRSTLGASR